MSIHEDTIEIKKNIIDEALLYPYQHQVITNTRQHQQHSKVLSFGVLSDFKNYNYQVNYEPTTVSK